MSNDTRLSRAVVMKPSGPPAHPADAAAKSTRPPHCRTYSNSSTSSTASDRNEDQFVFSPHRTPAHEHSSFFPSTSSRGVSVAGNGQSSVVAENSLGSARKQNTKPSPSISTDCPTPPSRPIAIELPASLSRKIGSSSVYTPIEPLSGRGDISGGYFPFHEDPDKRITRPHPFRPDSKEAGHQAASFREPASPPVRRPSVPKSAISDPRAPHTTMSPVKMPSSRSHTPVTSYVPSGLHEAPMPIGKYYPSNYEAARSRQSSSQNFRTPRSSLRPPSSSGGPSSVKSDTAVPQINRTDSSRGRSDSDAKRRLQQYQRDMVAQATQAARQLARGQGTSAHLAAQHGAPVKQFQAASPRPVSPRLQPLGSPGPVTPMELEGHGGEGGYLTRGRPVPSPDAGRESHAVARAMQAENERMRREGRGSPAIEASGFGF